MEAKEDETMSKKFSENFSALRKEKGLTQAEVAAKLNISAQAISKWENGESMPDVSLLSDIAELFDTSIDALFGRVDKEKVEVVEPPKGNYNDYFLRIDAEDDEGHGHARINIPLAVATIMFRGKSEITIGGFTLTQADFDTILHMVEAGAVGPLVDAEGDGGHAKIYVEKVQK